MGVAVARGPGGWAHSRGGWALAGRVGARWVVRGPGGWARGPGGWAHAGADADLEMGTDAGPQGE